METLKTKKISALLLLSALLFSCSILASETDGSSSDSEDFQEALDTTIDQRVEKLRKKVATRKIQKWYREKKREKKTEQERIEQERLASQRDQERAERVPGDGLYDDTTPCEFLEDEPVPEETTPVPEETTPVPEETTPAPEGQSPVSPAQQYRLTSFARNLSSRVSQWRDERYWNGVIDNAVQQKYLEWALADFNIDGQSPDTQRSILQLLKKKLSELWGESEPVILDDCIDKKYNPVRLLTLTRSGDLSSEDDYVVVDESDLVAFSRDGKIVTVAATSDTQLSVFNGVTGCQYQYQDTCNRTLTFDSVVSSSIELCSDNSYYYFLLVKKGSNYKVQVYNLLFDRNNRLVISFIEDYDIEEGQFSRIVTYPRRNDYIYFSLIGEKVSRYAFSIETSCQFGGLTMPSLRIQYLSDSIIEYCDRPTYYDAGEAELCIQLDNDLYKFYSLTIGARSNESPEIEGFYCDDAHIKYGKVLKKDDRSEISLFTQSLSGILFKEYEYFYDVYVRDEGFNEAQTFGRVDSASFDAHKLVLRTRAGYLDVVRTKDLFPLFVKQATGLGVLFDEGSPETLSLRCKQAFLLYMLLLRKKENMSALARPVFSGHASAFRNRLRKSAIGASHLPLVVPEGFFGDGQERLNKFLQDFAIVACGDQPISVYESVKAGRTFGWKRRMQCIGVLLFLYRYGILFKGRQRGRFLDDFKWIVKILSRLGRHVMTRIVYQVSPVTE